ncbi:MAG: hypothetical protein Q4G07_01270 [Oscillospiraceae bacterium]|nr:hypothetical protein [Oscillospiraceae bacterium]
MRRCPAAHLVWPCHPLSTINTLRRAVFNDRIEDTLFDISVFYSCLTPGLPIEEVKAKVRKSCRLHKAYLNKRGSTFAWLANMESFENFIGRMQLRRFTDARYRVIGLEGSKSPFTGCTESRFFTLDYWRHLVCLFRL